MPPLLLALLRSAFAVVVLAAAAAPAAGQSRIVPGDLDHVLGAALALAVQAADDLDGVVPASVGAAIASPDTLRGVQQRAFEAALVAHRAHSYLRLYVMHLAEPGGRDAPPARWAELLDALAAVSFNTAELVAVPAERLGEAPFDAAAARRRDAELADRVRTLAAGIGEEPARYED